MTEYDLRTCWQCEMGFRVSTLSNQKVCPACILEAVVRVCGPQVLDMPVAIKVDA